MKRVLVVDDDKDILTIVALVLELRGHEVMSVWESTKALRAVKEFSPDAILLDVYLGTGNGIQLCNQIKSDPETESICIIMFSAHANSDDILSQTKADGFIKKPFDIDHLSKAIEDCKVY